MWICNNLNMGFALVEVAKEESSSRGGLYREEKNEIPYKEGRMKDMRAHVGYKVLWGKVSKVVGAMMQMCYYPAARHFM